MTTALGTKDLAHATARFQVKATATEKRQFSGLLSTWDLDYGGDKIVKGAYAQTLADWKALGYKIPLIDQHTYDSVRKVVGKLLAAEETDDGLETTWQVVNSPEGDEYLARLRDDMIDGLSIGYEPIDQRPPSEAERRAGVQRVLTAIALKEGSLVIWGMNPNALIDTTSVKSIANGLAQLRRETLSEDDKKTVRQIASLAGALLRPVPADEKGEKAATDDDAQQPDASPASAAADTQTANPSALKADALRQRILALRIRHTIALTHGGHRT